MEAVSFFEKVEQVKALFKSCTPGEDTYHQIITLGRKLPPFAEEWKTKENLVSSCQSQVYLRTEQKNDHIFFSATADSLISAGLVYLLITVYSGESIETILTQEPTYLQDLGIQHSLTPNRANGLASMYLHMKRAVLPYLIRNKK